MTKKIVFEAGELADAYALKTLYDSLKERKFDERAGVEIFFRQPESCPYSSSVLIDYPFENLDGISSELSTDLYVQTYCDFPSEYHPKNILSIDISILKNCALPMSAEIKKKLKEMIGVKTTLPLLIASYAKNNDVVVDRLINENRESSEIYIMDGPYNGYIGNNIHLVNIFGVLREYYSIADVVVNAKNLVASTNFLHNFVEATEGGPFFMVRPFEWATRQFGYKELVGLEVIRECEDADDLTAKISKYLNRPIEQIRKEKEEHCNRRAEHIMQTREKYLPIIESEIEKMLNNESSSSGELWVRDDLNKRILQHPDSWWK